MKPRIYQGPGGYWFVRWRYPDARPGPDYWERRCLTWHVAVGQLCRLYQMGDVGREMEVLR